jgi:hypothetical protein
MPMLCWVLADALLQYRADRRVGGRVGKGPEPADRGRDGSEQNFAAMQHCLALYS